jgi:RNA polymerase sigma-70 factor (ECF subfamily)
VNDPISEGKEKMRWEVALPQPAAIDAAQADALPMDAEAFAGFYARSSRPLWAYLARCAGDRALAEDLMQESYVRFLASERLAELSREGEVAARRYLYRIASNLLRDHWRRPRTEPLEDAPEPQDSTGDATEAQMRLNAALAQIKPRDRQLLWLAYAEGYSHQEIAEVMGMMRASVRVLLYRARHAMARLLDNNDRRQA